MLLHPALQARAVALTVGLPNPKPCQCLCLPGQRATTITSTIVTPFNMRDFLLACGHGVASQLTAVTPTSNDPLLCAQQWTFCILMPHKVVFQVYSERLLEKLSSLRP
jgi:hypothetical protein